MKWTHSRNSFPLFFFLDETFILIFFYCKCIQWNFVVRYFKFLISFRRGNRKKIIDKGVKYRSSSRSQHVKYTAQGSKYVAVIVHKTLGNSNSYFEELSTNFTYISNIYKSSSQRHTSALNVEFDQTWTIYLKLATLILDTSKNK